MKLMALALSVCALGLVSVHADAQTKLKTSADSLSYGIGLQIGKNLKQQGAPNISVAALAQGLSDVMDGKTAMMTDEQVKSCFETAQKVQMAQMSQAGDKNKTEGEAFLAKNAKRPGVKVLPSGLQYEVLAEGTGPTPKASDEVTTNYKGTLIDGTVFDQTDAQRGPATFPVSGVIPGWTEALQLMKVGSKWRLYVPSNLAYGERGAGAQIGPNTTLVFDVELLGVKTGGAGTQAH